MLRHSEKSEKLAQTCEKQLRTKGSGAGVQGLVCLETKAFEDSDRISSSERSSKSQDFRRGSKGYAGKGCDFTSHQAKPRILQQDFHGQKEDRWFSSGNRSFPVEQEGCHSTFQDGNGKINPHGNSKRGFCYIDRSQGRLLSCPDEQGFLAIPEVCVERNSLPIQSSPVRPVTSPLHFYKDHKASSGFSKGKRHSSKNVFRRLAKLEPMPRRMPKGHAKGHYPISISGVQHQTRKIRPSPKNYFQVFGNDFRFGCLHSQTQRRQDRITEKSSQGTQTEKEDKSENLIECTGEDGVDGIIASLGKSSQETASKGGYEENTWIPRHGSPNCSRSVVSRSNESVDERSVVKLGSSDSISERSSFHSHGRLTTGVGRTYRHPVRRGALDSSGDNESHKSARARSSISMSEGVQGTPCSQGSRHLRRQYNLSGILEKSRRDKVGTIVSKGGTNSVMGRGKSYPCRNEVCARETKRSGRSTKSPETDSQHRVDNLSSRSTSNLESLGQTDDRFICHKVLETSSDLCFTNERPSSSINRCVSDVVEGADSICVSPNSTNSPGVSKNSSRETESNFGNTLLAIGELAARSHGSGKRRPSSLKSRKRPVSATTVRNSPQQPFIPEPNRMEIIKTELKKKRLSKDAIELALKSKRKSTKVNYGNKWLVWSNFCKDHKIRALYPTEKDVAEFLVSLYKTKNLKTATLKNYRSAIANTIKSATWKSADFISFSPLINDILEGIKNEFPEKNVSFPQWDLFLVLKSLLSKPYEPIESSDLQHLTMKTVFLVALASARRVSGVHAISGLDKDIEFAEGNKSMTLSFLPEFRAKNQIADTDRQSFQIKSLSQFLDSTEPDVCLCPVRALKTYLKRTSRFRGNKRRLFISMNPGHEKDICKNTITRWLKQVILEAYKSAGSSLNCYQVHEIRKLSTSLGLAKGVSLKHIMETAYWRSKNTFSSFYLRDITTKRVNQTYGIDRVVVANSVITL